MRLAFNASDTKNDRGNRLRVASTSGPKDSTPPSPFLADASALNAGAGHLQALGDAQDERVVEQLISVANLAAETITKQRERINFLERLSVTDELTGLLNRRGFEDALDRVLAQSHRYKESGVLALIDLDEFKPINDRYGHAAGDAVLKHVGDLLLRNTRSTDYVARLGGDEFAVIYVRAESQPTRARAHSIIETLNNSTTYFDSVTIPVKASVGFREFGPDTTKPDLMIQADCAMYHAKSSRKAVA